MGLDMLSAKKKCELGRSIYMALFMNSNLILVFAIFATVNVKRAGEMPLPTLIQGCRIYCFSTKANEKQSRNRKSYPSIPKQVRFMEGLVPPLMAALVALSPIYSNTPVSLGQTVDIQRGATLFHQACIGCHDGGGNIIQPGATLFLQDLQRNGVDSVEDIYRVSYYGKGRMPGFGESCTPRGQCTFGARLQDEEIKLLADFVKLQADQGWPNIGGTEK